MVRTIPVKNFIVALASAKVYYDPAFQRRYGAWVRTQKSKYLANVFNGQVHSVIVLADARACLEHSRRLGDRPSIEKLEELIERGFDYISLDGQHRTNTILDFFNNGLTVTRDFEDFENKIHKCLNVYWKDLPKIIKPQLLSNSIHVSFVTDAVYSEFAPMYQDLNAGEPQNDQEHRSAYPSPVANQIRTWREVYKDALARVVREKIVIRMGDDELLVKFAISLIRKYNYNQFQPTSGFKSADLDRWYTIGNSVADIGSSGSPYVQEEFDRAERILDILAKVLEKQEYYPHSKSISNKMTWAALFASEWAYDSNYNITDHGEFFKLLKKIDDELANSSLREFTKTQTDKIENDEDPEDIKRNDYYFAWAQLVHYGDKRAARRNALVDRLEEERFVCGLSSMYLAEMRQAAA